MSDGGHANCRIDDSDDNASYNWTGQKIRLSSSPSSVIPFVDVVGNEGRDSKIKRHTESRTAAPIYTSTLG